MEFKDIRNKLKKELSPIFEREVELIRQELLNCKYKRNIVNLACEHLYHHNYYKCFLIYNTFQILNQGEIKIPKNIFVICEILTVPVLFLDDILDKHSERKNIQTVFSLCQDEYRDKASVICFGILSTIYYHLVRRILKLKLRHETKNKLIEEIFISLEKTYSGGLLEQITIEQTESVKKLEDLLALYKMKTYPLFFKMPFEWASILANNKENLLDLALNLSYLVQIKNDVADLNSEKNLLSMYLRGKPVKKELIRIVGFVKSNIENRIKKLESSFPHKKNYVNNFNLYLNHILLEIYSKIRDL